MANSWYSFDVSPIWVFGALISALAIALLLYTKRGTPWNMQWNILLGFLRFGAIFLILILLLNPFFEMNINQVERPVVILAIDNSGSIQLRSSDQINDLKLWLTELEEKLNEKYELVQEYLLESAIDSLTFDGQSTDLSRFLNGIESAYTDQNLGGVVLISDGIFNKGQSPAFENFNFPIFTLGLGDTLPPKDITIQSIRFNRVAYQGNQYPVRVAIKQSGFQGQSEKVMIYKGNSEITGVTKTLQNGLTNYDFVLDAPDPGLQRLTVKATHKASESTYANNSRDLYVDVIEGKDKVLILAPAPHPDIHAIRNILDASSNYETILYIPGIHDRPANKEFDVILEHQAFSKTRYGDYSASGKWMILGSKSNMALMNKEVSYINLKQRRGQKDLAGVSFNASFSKFKLTESLLERLQNYPPIEVPFGKYEVNGPAEIALFQRIGRIVTERPMLTFFDDGTSKSATLLGEGLWQWKLQEAGSEQTAELLQEIVLKTVQYLSIKVNKDRFVVRPRNFNYQIGDRVFLDTEVYNEIFERAYGNTITLTLTDENGQTTDYELVDSPVSSSFNLGNLNAGIYRYQAKTQIGGKAFAENGSLAIRDIQLESVNLTADHNLLKTLALNSGGNYHHFNNRDEMVPNLIDMNATNRLSTITDSYPLISSLWVILLIMSFLGTEWFLRKFLGAY